MNKEGKPSFVAVVHLFIYSHSFYDYIFHL
jgi:hypothetical protein